jgi:hypothetical protein
MQLFQGRIGRRSQNSFGRNRVVDIGQDNADRPRLLEREFGKQLHCSLPIGMGRGWHGRTMDIRRRFLLKAFNRFFMKPRRQNLGDQAYLCGMSHIFCRFYNVS